jgi:hypothetical protein
MKNRTKIILLASVAVIGAGFYYSKKIDAPDGTEISPIKRGIGGALIGASFASFIIVIYELVKK